MNPNATAALDEADAAAALRDLEFETRDAALALRAQSVAWQLRVLEFFGQYESAQALLASIDPEAAGSAKIKDAPLPSECETVGRSDAWAALMIGLLVVLLLGYVAQDAAQRTVEDSPNGLKVEPSSLPHRPRPLKTADTPQESARAERRTITTRLPAALAPHAARLVLHENDAPVQTWWVSYVIAFMPSLDHNRRMAAWLKAKALQNTA
jgi:hypothetical protein